MPPQKLLDQSKRAKNFISSKGKNFTARQFISYWTIMLHIKSNINKDYSTTLPQIHKWLIVGVRLSPLLHGQKYKYKYKYTNDKLLTRLSPLLHGHHPPRWLHSSQRGKVRADHDYQDHHGRDHDHNHNGKSGTSFEEWWKSYLISLVHHPDNWRLLSYSLDCPILLSKLGIFHQVATW